MDGGRPAPVSFRRVWGVVLVLVVLTLAFRLVALDAIPPHLYYDEAGQGLDARDVLQGTLRGFFSRSMGKEPLYIYLTVPFVAVADTEPIAVRLPAALLGALTTLALFMAARGLWGREQEAGVVAGITAAALWAVNYWPQSVNRLGFRVNALPLLLVLSLMAWTAWVRRPERGRAFRFGVLAGGTLMTYLAARITPLLWGIWFFGAVSPAARRRMWPTVPWVVGGALIGAAPLLVHFLLNPADAVSRVTTFPVWSEARQASNVLRFFAESTWNVLGGFFGWAGDPIPRHNIPGRPPFFPVVSPFFLGGLTLALWEAVRGTPDARFRSRTVLVGWIVLLIPAILAAADNPHFLRLFGAVPFAFLLVGGFAARLWQQAGDRAWRQLLVLLWVALFLLEGARTGYAYFYRWARQMDLYTWFQEDVWTIGETIRRTPEAVGVVPLNPFYGDTYREYVLDYVFRDVPIWQMRVLEDRVEDWLQVRLGAWGGKRVMVTVWHEGEHVNADPKDVLGFYLRREGELEARQAFRGFELVTYRLGPRPEFQVRGRKVALNAAFQRGVTLVDARWGVAYPNPDREQPEVAAGTAIWAILTWQLTAPQPDLKVTLDLVDGEGRRIASDERYLLDENRWPTSRWQPGTLGRSYHLVIVPATQVPGPLYLESRVYEGDRLVPIPPRVPTPRGSVRWGRVTVTPAMRYPDPETLRLDVSLQQPVSPELVLLGVAVWPKQVAPGQLVTLRLYWRVRQQMESPWRGELWFGDQVKAAVVVPSDLPPGAVVHTDVSLVVPPDLGMGTYPVVLAGEDKLVSLGPLTVAGRPRSFTPPDEIPYPLNATFGPGIRLLGMTDVRQEGRTLRFTLIWQVPGAQPRSLKRFVHLLGENQRPLAQEDVIPCGGDCPSGAWLSGEVLLDNVVIPLPDDLPAGVYPLAVGWYDAVTLERLPAYDERGQEQPNGLLVLPQTVTWP